MRTRSLALLALFLGSAAACASTPQRAPFPLPARVQAPLLATESSEPAPPEPKKEAKRFDWIKLKTGEWLKGEIITMRNQSIEFDSAELDELTFDFEKIVEIRSDRENTIVLEGQRIFTGRIFMKGNEIRLAGVPRAFDRSQLVSIVPGDMKEIHFWKGKLSLGAEVRAGNTNQTDYSAYARITRRGPLSRLDFTYNGAFGKVDGEETINNHRATGRWDIFLTRKWFVTPIGLEYYRDVFQNIKLRLTPYAGGGYYIFDEPRIEWSVDAGGGYRFEEPFSTEQGTASTNTAVVSIGTDFDWDITSKVEWTTRYSLQISVPDSSATNSHFFTQLSFDLFKDLDLDISFTWDRIGNPVPDASGETPVPDDFRTSIGIGWDF